MFNFKTVEIIGDDPELDRNPLGGGYGHGFVGDSEKLKQMKVPKFSDFTHDENGNLVEKKK